MERLLLRKRRLKVGIGFMGVAAVAVLALFTTGSFASNKASCSVPYNKKVLMPNKLPANLNPKLAVPPISHMTIRSTDLGTSQKYKPAWWNTLKVTPAEQKAICAKHLTAVYLDWDKVLYNQAMRSGAKHVLAALGIKLLRETSFNFDPNGLAGDLAAVLPLHPNIIFTGGTIDPNQMATILAPAAKQHIEIVSWGVGAKGWKVGKGQPLTGLVSYDFYNLGTQMAVAVHNQYPKGMNLGWVHWINNIAAIHLRENGLLTGLKKYKNIKVISDGGPPNPSKPNSGFSDPNTAQPYTQAFLTRHPEVNVLFAPWEDPPAVGEESAIRSAGKTGKVQIVTMDLGTTGAQELEHNGAITVDMAEDVYDGGRAMALIAGLDAIGKKTPPYVIVPTFAANKTNLKNAWLVMHGPDFPLPK